MNFEDEWEILPDDGFLEIHDDGGKQIYSRKYQKRSTRSVFQRNYFICPPKSPQFVETTQTQLLPVPIVLESTAVSEQKSSGLKILPSEGVKSVDSGPIEGGVQDPISQIFFKKIETEFVDMKVESPKFADMKVESPKFADMKYDLGESEDDDEEEEGGLNIWKKSLNGIGAICSFGMAAATVCIIIFSSHQKNTKNQKLLFQIQSIDKGIKQVFHNASRLNEAGVPMARARITVGGHYDATL